MKTVHPCKAQSGPVPDSYRLAWHQAECGLYRADLPAWLRLAGDQPVRILDLGCGSGRVAGELQKVGHSVTGLDHDPLLVEEMNRVWPGVDSVVADARNFKLPSRFDLVLAPMQLLQLFTAFDDRQACLRTSRRHLGDGGRFIAALVDLAPDRLPVNEDLLADGELSPDRHEIEPGLEAVSTPTGFRVDSEGLLTVSRRREIIAVDRTTGRREPLCEATFSQQMALLDSTRFETELRQAGMRLIGWHRVEATEQHMGSLIAVAEPV